jgi:hypothetical protein
MAEMDLTRKLTSKIATKTTISLDNAQVVSVPATFR